MARTILGCASGVGGAAALVRLSGPGAREVAAAAGLRLPAPWRVLGQSWPLGGGSCPCLASAAMRGRSYTGEDLVELLIPGAPDLVEIAIAALRQAGAEPAEPGEFTRQALANGRMTLLEAEAVLSLTMAGDAAAAARALSRLQGELGLEVAAGREQLLVLRAQVEAGLDFVEEDGVSPAVAEELQAGLAGPAAAAATLAGWRQARARACRWW